MKIQGIKGILKNIMWLSLGEGASRFLLLFIFIYSARILGPENFGVFNFALAFASVFVIFSNLGISDITTRELAKDQEKVKHYPGILLLRILLSAGALLLIFVASFFITQDEQIRSVIWILGAYVLLHNFLMVVYAFFRARHQMKYEVLLRISEAFLIVLIGFIMLVNNASVVGLSYAFLLATLIVSFFSVMFFSMTIKPVWRSFDIDEWKNIIKISWPIGIAYAFGMVYIRMDSVIMGAFGQITQVGWYSAAYRIAGALIVPSTLIGASFFPVLSKLFNESREKCIATFKFYVKIMLILAITITFLGLFFSSYIIEFFYGQVFSPAIPALQILVIMSALNYIYGPMYLFLIASNKQKIIFWISLSGAIFNIILNLILIPKYSLYGAAIATLCTYVLLVVLAMYYVRIILIQKNA